MTRRLGPQDGVGAVADHAAGVSLAAPKEASGAPVMINEATMYTLLGTGSLGVIGVIGAKASYQLAPAQIEELHNADNYAPWQRCGADRQTPSDRALFRSRTEGLVVVVEKNQCVGQVAVDEVSAAAEGVMHHGPERVRCIHDTRNVPHRNAGVVDPFERVVE